MEANTTNRGMTETSGGSHMQEELDSLKDSFNKLRSDVTDLVSHAFGFGRGSAEMARNYGNDAMEGLKHRVNDIRARGEDQMHTIEQEVQEKPLTSAMIAFGVGFLIAKMMGHKH